MKARLESHSEVFFGQAGSLSVAAGSVLPLRDWYFNFPNMKYQSLSGSTDPAATDKEPAWPKNTSECDSSRAFITHRVSDSPGSKLWDVGHLGRFDATGVSKLFLQFSLT